MYTCSKFTLTANSAVTDSDPCTMTRIRARESRQAQWRPVSTAGWPERAVRLSCLLPKSLKPALAHPCRGPLRRSWLRCVRQFRVHRLALVREKAVELDEVAARLTHTALCAPHSQIKHLTLCSPLRLRPLQRWQHRLCCSTHRPLCPPVE